jgi:uncharacterized protein
MKTDPLNPAKIIVIYHRADFDGLFCREVARKFLGDDDSVEYVGWDYGDDTLFCITDDTLVYMLDISVEALMDHPNLIWIDHHKSAMEKFPESIRGYRIDGVAASRLAYQWFSLNFHGHTVNGEEVLGLLPAKSRFVDRWVKEPHAVRLAGEYDIWDKRDPDAELFQHGLRSLELTPYHWNQLLSEVVVGDETCSTQMVKQLLDRGEALQYASTQQNASIIKAYGFTVKFEGLTFLACNHARFNSHLFTAGIRPEHDALLGFNFDGPNKTWRFSMYGIPGKDIDLSVIAVKFGGGGHRGACGFRWPTFCIDDGLLVLR